LDGSKKKYNIAVSSYYDGERQTHTKKREVIVHERAMAKGETKSGCDGQLLKGCKMDEWN
jgi:hypothetical protein